MREKKPHYKKIAFDRLTEEWERRLYVIRSTGVGKCISAGYDRQRAAFKHMLASKKYVRLEYDFPVELPDGHRSTQKIDIVGWKINGDIDCFDSKSETTNGTYDPHITVVGHLSARDQLSKRFPGSTVNYYILRLGGDSDPIWTNAGISTLDTNAWLSDLCGYEIDLFKEEHEARVVPYLKRLAVCCKHIGKPYQYGLDIFREIGVPDC